MLYKIQSLIDYNILVFVLQHLASEYYEARDTGWGWRTRRGSLDNLFGFIYYVHFCNISLKPSNQEVQVARLLKLCYKWKETSRWFFFFTYNSKRFGKDTGIFGTPKLRAQVVHHTFTENILSFTRLGNRSTKELDTSRELF